MKVQIEIKNSIDQLAQDGFDKFKMIEPEINGISIRVDGRIDKLFAEKHNKKC